MSPARLAARDELICLAICGLVVFIDPTALANTIRVAVMSAVVVGVPLVNFLVYRRRAANTSRMYHIS